MNDASRVEKTEKEEEEEEQEGRIQRRKRGSPAVRINDVSRVHITKEGKKDCSNRERERKTI